MDHTSFDREIQSIGEGWWPIARALHTTIEALAPGYRIAQIKEKFGGLRYYYDLPQGTPDLTSSTIQVLVDAAEALSFRTCEWCGRPATTRNSHGWLVTLCDEHFEEREARRRAEWGTPREEKE